MSIGSVSSLNSFRTQMHQFQTGQKNLQKSDLETMQAQKSEAQSQGVDPFAAILEAFDEIDQNQDGISIDELQTYAEERGIDVEKQRPIGPPPSMAMELGGAQGTPPQGGRPPGPPPGPPPGEGASGITMEELAGIQSELEEQGMEVPDELASLISAFDSLDTNQDGEVTLQEMMAAISGNESEEAVGSVAESDGSENGNLEGEAKDEVVDQALYEKINANASNNRPDGGTAMRLMQAISQYAQFSDNSSSLVNGFDWAG